MSLAPANLNELTSFYEYVPTSRYKYTLLYTTYHTRTTNIPNPQTQQQTQTPTPWNPQPPVSRGFNFIGEIDCLTLHGGAWSKQHSDVLFLLETNCSFILLTIIL